MLSTNLDDRIDVDEIHSLDLVRVQAMWTLHPRQYSHYLLSERTNMAVKVEKFQVMILD